MTIPFPEDRASASPAVSPQTLVLQIGWAVVVATLGGFLCALVLDWVGEVGSISLWGLGAFAGFVSWKIAWRRSPAAAWALVVAMIVALLIAETLWIHWNIVQAAESVWTAMSLLPTFFKEYKVAGFVGALMSGFGAYSAYRQNA